MQSPPSSATRCGRPESPSPWWCHQFALKFRILPPPFPHQASLLLLSCNPNDPPSLSSPSPTQLGAVDKEISALDLAAVTLEDNIRDKETALSVDEQMVLLDGRINLSTAPPSSIGTVSCTYRSAAALHCWLPSFCGAEGILCTLPDGTVPWVEVPSPCHLSAWHSLHSLGCWGSRHAWCCAYRPPPPSPHHHRASPPGAHHSWIISPSHFTMRSSPSTELFLHERCPRGHHGTHPGPGG